MVLVTALGALTGAVNGLIRTRIGIPSFIVTLAMLVAYRSGALIASGERPLTTRGRTPFYALTGGELFGIIPWHVVWMARDHGDRRPRARAHPLRLSPLCDRRQPRGRALCRHQHRPGQARGLHADRRALRPGRRAAVRLSAGRRADHRHRLRVPGDRRRDRGRRRADRRPRHDLWQPGRRADHQHDHQRPGPATASRRTSATSRPAS